MLDTPKFSIIIPAFNAEKTIEKSISSIHEQTFQDFEIIIINDGSTDRTPSILEELSEQNLKIRFKTIENSGPGEARNIGIDFAKGEYIVFVDVDDFLKPNFLEVYNSLLMDNNLDLIITGYRTKVYNNDELISEHLTTYPTTLIKNYEDFIDQLYLLTNSQMMYVVWNKVYKKSIIQQNNVRFPRYRSCEDRIFNLRYFQNVNNILVSDLINFDYSFDGKNSLTNRFIENKYETFEHWYELLLETVNHDFDGYASLFLKGVMSTFVSLHADSCLYSYQEKRNYIKNVLKQKEVISAGKISSTETIMKLLIAFVIRTNNVTINYFSSKMIHFISQESPHIIERFKSKH